MYNTHDIWPSLYSSHQRCLQAIQRLELSLTEQSELTRADYVQLLNYRLTTANAKVKPIVLERLTNLDARPEALPHPVKSVKAVKPGLARPVPPVLIRYLEQIAHWTTSRAIIFLTLMGALSIQIHHLALLVHQVSPQDSLILAYIFGIVSETTALMLTVHQARKGLLLLFAFIQCWINVLYYCELPDLFIRLTLSGLIAFVIYSYSELFTSLRSTEQSGSLFGG